MITAVTIAGQPLDPCHVLADAVVIHGRRSYGEPGQPSSATIVVEQTGAGMPAWQSGDTVTLDTPEGRLFSGRIVERQLAHVRENDGTVTGLFTLTAAGALAALGVRQVGDVPWPQETGAQRAERILTAAAVPHRVEGPSDLQILPRDVDAQPALGLLDELAAATGAVVFDTPSGEVVYQTLQSRSRPIQPYMWQDFDAAFTWDDFDPALTWDGDPPSLAQWPSPGSTWPVVLPCETVVWEPEWRSAEAAIINHVRIAYGLPPEGEDQAAVQLEDAASINAHGRRYLPLVTDLATAADANARAAHILTTQYAERWEIGDVVVALDLLDAATYSAVFGLLCGDPVTLKDMPQPAPATDWTGILEGWSYTMSGASGALAEQIVLAVSDPLQSMVAMIWSDYPGTYLWSDHPAHLTWDDLTDTSVLEAA